MVKKNPEEEGSAAPRRSIGIRDVARHAGVSTATVSRALNKPDAVSRTLRERIEMAIEEIGYIPDASARALSSRRTRTVGAIVPTVDNAMFAQGLQALQSYLATEDYLLLLATNNYDLDVELEQARNLVGRGIDALILRGDERHPALRKMLATQNIPFVDVGVYHPDKPYASVGVDNVEAGRALARYITGLGHRRIAMISARTTNNDRARARQRGVLEVLDTFGCAPPPPWHLHIHYRLDEARDAMRALLGRDARPTAVICGNDVLAYGALLEAIRENVRVPEDLSIAGFDDLEWSRHLQPTLTTIHMPTNEIWVRAGRYLVDRLDARESLLHQKVEFSLIVRESTASPPSTQEG